MAWLWKIPWVRRQRIRLRRPMQILLAPAIVNYIKLVINTSTIVADPPDFVGRARALPPSISALWPGQFFQARAEEFQRYQKQVEAAINDVTARAYALAAADMTRGSPPGDPARRGQSQRRDGTSDGL